MTKPVNPLDALRAFVARAPTQREAARLLGVSDPFLSDMLNDKCPISKRTLAKLGLKTIVVKDHHKAEV